jgi:hypothetical protein
MSATISSADEYKEAAERAKVLSDNQEGTPEAAEAADLAAAMQKWEDSRKALDEKAGNE